MTTDSAMPTDIEITAADREAAKGIYDHPCIEFEGSDGLDIARYIASCMRPERERAARIEKALRDLIRASCLHCRGDMTCSVQPGCNAYIRNICTEARAALSA